MFLLSLIINLEKLFPENPNNDCLHFATKMFSFRSDRIFPFFSVVELKEKIDEWKRQKQNKKWKIRKQTFDIEVKQKKKVMNNFFIYYITTTTLIKKRATPFFLLVIGHTPNIFRLILCTTLNILQEDSDWSTQFHFPPIKFQEISRYSQMNQWEARSRTTIHFFKIFRLWPSNL